MREVIISKRIVFVFIDGIGIGKRDPQTNPFAHPEAGLFAHFLDDAFPKQIASAGYAVAVDANLGTPGLPQSATGQTAIFTGKNASSLLGRHLNAFPNQRLRDLIREESIFRRLLAMNKKPVFLNAFRPPFFDFDPWDIIRHLSVTTVMNYFAGLPFMGIDDILNHRSIYQDMTNEHLIMRGFDVPVFSPELAGEIAAKQSQEYDFMLFEYFQTDKAGHSMDMDRGKNEVQKISRFLETLLARVGKETIVIVASDHGNLEELSLKSHTRNPAMAMVFGAEAKECATRLHSLTDYVPLILDLIG